MRGASCSEAVLGLPTIMRPPGARAIDAAAAVEACGPKQNIGAPKFAFSARIASTSASSVGVVLGKTMSVGLKPSRSTRVMTPSIDSRSAVASISRTASRRRSSAPASAKV